MPNFKRLTSFLLLFTAVAMLGQGCSGSSAAEQQATAPVTLKVWRVFDDDDTFRQIMNNYRELHANISFEYREFRIEEYEDELIRAFAEGTGPDIFSIHNTWIGAYQNLITPLPKSLVIPYVEIKGTVKKEKVVTLREEPTISLRKLKNDFLDVVSEDVVRDYRPTPQAQPESRVFGLPLSVDTLAVYYNKDLLNAAGISEAPKTWSEFIKAVPKLTSVGDSDQILQAGAALGTGKNIDRSFDILSTLMMQNGTDMTDARGRATFSRDTITREAPGLDALRFYTDFANPLKEVYSWNNKQPSSFDSFVNGRAAFFFGYSYHLPLLRARAPSLRFGVSQFPQIADSRVVNYGNYWVETVAKATENATWAWDFVQFAASESQVVSYLNAARKPPALRSLINSQLEDEDLAVFAGQLLTAKSWYKGKDATAAEAAFIDLIDRFLTSEEQERELQTTENKVNQTL